MDVSMLRGSSVRSSSGLQGRLLGVSGPWIKLGWDDPEQALPREESFLRSDPFLDEEVEILTVDAGWVPLGLFVGAQNEMRPRVRSLDSILGDLQDLFPVTTEGLLPSRSARLQEGVEVFQESPGGKAHSPFKTAAKTFIGPRGGWHHRFPGQSKGKHMNRHHKKDVWDCSSEGPYKQICVAQKDVPEQGIKKGQTKTVTQPASSKAKYNKEYKAFMAASHEKASRSRLLKRIKHKEKAKAKAQAAKGK